MSLNERITKVKPYFVTFNVNGEEDAMYVVAKFPQTWAIPDKSGLLENFKVQVAPMNNGICFVTESENGADCVFDALDYVIDFNKSVEERKALLMEKVNELKQLFSTETLEKLKTLTFIFEPQKKKGPKKKKSENVEMDKNAPVNEEEHNEEAVNDSALMSFAKKIAEE